MPHTGDGSPVPLAAVVFTAVMYGALAMTVTLVHRSFGAAGGVGVLVGEITAKAISMCMHSPNNANRSTSIQRLSIGLPPQVACAGCARSGERYNC